MNILTERPISLCPGQCLGEYIGLTFDGCYYYFIKPNDYQIIQLTKCFEPHATVPVCRNYTCICYDAQHCCFWAASGECFHKLFKLNKELQEIDCLDLREQLGCCAAITGVSCCECERDGYLLIAATTGILKYSVDHGDGEMVQTNQKDWITGIVSICPGYMISFLQEGKQFLQLFDGCNHCVFKWQVPKGYFINGMMNSFAQDIYPNVCLRLLATKNGCYPYLLDVILSPDELTFTPCCPYTPYHGDCRPPRPPRPSPNACNDVLESVALVEAALAHILNAEGEKIQKVVATTSDVDKMLCVNRDVRETIIRATQLEHALYEKLTALGGCGGCHDKPCSFSKDELMAEYFGE